MTTQQTRIGDLRPAPNNPRLIKDAKFKQLCQSLKDHPEMMEVRPIVADHTGMILGGNMRWRAAKEIGLTSVPAILLPETWTEEQKRAFCIKDNVGYGTFDWDMLANEWDAQELADWGLGFPEDWAKAEELDPEIQTVSEDVGGRLEIVIECATEDEQEQLFNEFNGRGIKCKVLAL